MAILENNIPYAPYIDSTLSAFSIERENLTIPYTHNPAINSSDISGFCLRIRYAYDNSKISEKLDNITTQDYNNSFATFDITDIKDVLKVGQFYKVQLAYVSKEGIIGSFSQVGVIKCARAGTVQIVNYSLGKVNEKKRKLLGLYTSADDDIYEKEYSYYFQLQDAETLEVLDNTGWIKHNTVENNGQDVYNLDTDLAQNKIYSLTYGIKTLNSLTTSVIYNIIDIGGIEPYYENLGIIAELDEDNGCVNLTLNNGDDEEFEGKGSFSITRCEGENTIWSEIKILSDVTQCQDFLVEYGKTYRYRVQQINKYKLYSKTDESKETDKITVYFNHSYLFDGTKQLNIGYNGDMSSLKNNVLESKTDTIGSTYPFLFRNGIVQYKEFPLSSLLSLVTDDQKYFSADVDHTVPAVGYHNGVKEEIDIDITKGETNVYQYNEKKFKMTALDWLSDGNVKLLKTPTEGNFLVRLMNVSLSPESGLNRLLHNFSATAYEIAEYSIVSLQNYNFIESVDDITVNAANWENNVMGTIQIEKQVEFTESFKERNIKYIWVSGAIPGTKIKVTNKEELIIGATGRLETQVDWNNVTDITITPAGSGGTLTYLYDVVAELSDFNKITNYTIYQVPLTSFAGQGFILIDKDTKDEKGYYNIKDSIFDEFKMRFDKWFYLGFKDRRKTAKEVENVNTAFVKPSGYEFVGFKTEIELLKLKNGNEYEYYNVRHNLFVNSDGSVSEKIQHIKVTDLAPIIKINDVSKTIGSTTKYIVLTGDELKINEIKVNDLVSIDCGFQYIENTYEDDFVSTATDELLYLYEYKKWCEERSNN